jgi:hypothetical protein
MMPAGCFELPGVQQLDADQVAELLRVCIKIQLLDQVPRLLALPAAQLLPAAAIAGLLQDFLQAVPSYKEANSWGRSLANSYAMCWDGLLGLPPVAEMAVEAVQQLYDAAFELGFAGMAKAIVKAVLQSAEAVRAVCGERFVHGMLAAIRHVRVSEGGDLMFWAQEPGLQSLDTGSCVQVLEALLQLCGEVKMLLLS